MSLQITSLYTAPIALLTMAQFAYGATNLGGLEGSDGGANTEAAAADTTEAKTDAATKDAATKDAATEAATEAAATEAATEAAATEVAATGNTAAATTNTNLVQNSQVNANSNTQTTVWWTPSAGTTTTGTNTANSEPNASTKSATYNQWGFTGSQSVWKPETLSSMLSGSSSSGSHSHHNITTKSNSSSTSNRLRNPLANEKDFTWKNVLLIGGVVGVSVVFNAL